jgi:hypothetical protein
MISCAYCGRPATLKILSNPEQVCFEHALEFWNGLLVYARDTSAPCMKHERLCTCPACEDASRSWLRDVAIAAAGPSPEGECVPMWLAS